jgi:hypothetical protein
MTQGPGSPSDYPLARGRELGAEVDELLDQVREQYKADVWNTNSTIELQLARPDLDPAAREKRYSEEVEALIAASAAETSPINAVIHLENAV